MIDKTTNNARQDAEIESIKTTCRETREALWGELHGVRADVQELSKHFWILWGKSAALGALAGMLAGGVVAAVLWILRKT